MPVLLPPTTPYAEAATAVVARLDGLVIPAARTSRRERYGEEPHERTDELARRPGRLGARAARRRRRRAACPVLGVCRGMQVMAVHAGGTLDQHVPDLVGHERHNPGGDAFGEIAVSLSPREPARRRWSATRSTVHCHHHQSVRDHPGFAAVAWADDGHLEAMEAPGDRLCVAVQWHPEVAADAGLFRALVEAASSR